MLAKEREIEYSGEKEKKVEKIERLEEVKRIEEEWEEK